MTEPDILDKRGPEEDFARHLLLREVIRERERLSIYFRSPESVEQPVGAVEQFFSKPRAVR